MSTSSELPHVAFIGLGAMGFAMSTHLVRTGFTVTGYDIFAPICERWQATCDNDIPNSKAQIAKSPADAVKSADVVCMMVNNHHHVHSALFDKDTGAVHALPKGMTVVVHATIPPTQPVEIRKRLSEEFQRPDIKLIDAPVSGGVARSANGTLTIMASSDDHENLINNQAVQSALSNLASKGKTLFAIPGGLGSGESAKALNQVMCGIHIVASSEILGLAHILGLDAQKIYETFISKPATSSSSSSTDSIDLTTRNQGWSWMIENRGRRVIQYLSNDTPRVESMTAVIDKDVNIIRVEENRLDITLPLLNRAADTITEVMNTGDRNREDDTVIVKHYLTQSQSSPPQQPSSATSNTPSVNLLATAHAMIHLQSAYETVKFAQALDMMGAEQRRMWFAIISGAAGGSTTFSTVMPGVLRLDDDAPIGGSEGGMDMPQVGDIEITAGFRRYAHQTFGMGKVEDVETIISDAKAKGYHSNLLEAAVEFLRNLLVSA